MWRSLILGVVALVAVGLAPAEAAKRLALVIGNNAYANLPALQKAVGDAHAMRATLETLGFEVTLAENTGYGDMAKAVADFESRIEPGDTVFLHFSGHGVSIDGRNYLIPTDLPQPTGGEGLVTRLSFDAADLIASLNRREPALVIAVLDACRNNPFSTTGRSVGADRGLARMDAPSGVFIMFSAGPGEAAQDRLGNDDDATTSVFTRTLIPNLATPGLSLVDVAKRTQAEVQRLAATRGERQFPDYSDRVIGNVVLVPADGTAAKDPAAVELAYWNAIQTSSDRKDFETFVATFPASPLVGAAKSRMAAIDAAASAAADRKADAPKVALADPAAGAGTAKAVDPAAAAPATDAPAADVPADPAELARGVQTELARVGCYTGKVDGVWGLGSATAVRRFADATGKTDLGLEPSAALLKAIKGAEGRICAAVEAAGPVVRPGPAPEVRRRPVPRAVDRIRERRRAGGGNCFGFNGQVVC